MTIMIKVQVHPIQEIPSGLRPDGEIVNHITAPDGCTLLVNAQIIVAPADQACAACGVFMGPDRTRCPACGARRAVSRVLLYTVWQETR
jgi:hypothetical protein